MTNPGRPRSWRVWACLFLFFVLLVTAQPARGAEGCFALGRNAVRAGHGSFLALNSSPNANAPGAGNGPRDPAEVEAFFDAHITAQLEEYGIPGAGVVVVADGEVVFAKGYGVKNLKTREPIVAEKTLFHIGSVTKLFTWTAVMQLVEQGRLDMDADINTYLTAFQFPDTFPEPITMEHLITHTPGFEDRMSTLMRLSRNDGLPLEEFVILQQPTRVMPPGEIIGYSNYGGTLGGYIVQEITGEPFETYIEENIFTPLGMTRSSIYRPVLPETLRGDVASGHLGFPWGVEVIEEYFPSAPMVGISATLPDIAKFMNAHLQNGCLSENQCILQAATIQNMHSQHFTHDPRLPGVTYGLVEWERNGVRSLWHGGSTPSFQGVLLLIPEDNVGLFLSYNRKTGRTEIGKDLRETFLDHYYPIDVPAPVPMPGYQERVARYVGDYHESRWAYTTADSFIYMLIRYYKARANADGTLEFMEDTYVEVEPLVFHQVDGQGTLLFHEDDAGRIQYGFYDYDPHKVFIRVPWYDTLNVHLAILSICQLIFMSALVGWERVHKEINHWLRWIGIAYLVYMPAMFLIGLSITVRIVPSFGALAPVFLVGLILAVGGSALLTVLAWKNKDWTLGTRIHCTAVLLAGVIFCIWLQRWNFLGVWHF